MSPVFISLKEAMLKKILLVVGLMTSLQAAAAPDAASFHICRPTFDVSGETMVAGTAFILQDPKKPRTLLLTAHHLFGEAGGLSRQFAGHELPSAVSKTECKWFKGNRTPLKAGPALPVKNAGIFFAPGSQRDMAVFSLPAKEGQALELAPAAAKVGDTVWLVARVQSGAPPALLLHKARVVRVEGPGLLYAFENAQLSIAATSGAPVVNEDGKLVGVNEGGGLHKGVMYGDALGLEALRAALLELP